MKRLILMLVVLISLSAKAQSDYTQFKKHYDRASKESKALWGILTQCETVSRKQGVEKSDLIAKLYVEYNQLWVQTITKSEDWYLYYSICEGNKKKLLEQLYTRCSDRHDYIQSYIKKWLVWALRTQNLKAIGVS